MVGLVYSSVLYAHLVLVHLFLFPFLLLVKVKCFYTGPNTSWVLDVVNSTALVSLKELCRLESKTGTRNSDSQHGNLRLVAPPHRNSSAAAPTLKNLGMAESVYKTNLK